MQGSSGDEDINNRHIDTVGEGEGVGNWDISIEAYTLSYVKWITSENLWYDAGSSNWCSVTT